MYSLKYGTVPVVRATGGLDDSIREFDPAEGTGNGFKFADYTSEALSGAVKKAVRTFAQKPQWSKAVQNAMAGDFSWERSAQEYGLLYKSLIGR
jgi:starch synthase